MHRTIFIFLALICLHGCSATTPRLANETQTEFLSDIRQVTFAGARSGEGYFNPSGTKLVFQSEREADNPFFQIYLADLERARVSRLSPGHGKTTCAWLHPDGTKALFSSTHHDPAARQKQDEEFAKRKESSKRSYSWDYDEEYEIYVRELDSDKLRRITNTRGYDAEASYSPDGTEILFASNRGAYTRLLTPTAQDELERDPSTAIDLYIMNADGSNVRRLTNFPGYDGGPFFSTDGKKIVWRRFDRTSKIAEIFTMNRNGRGAQQLTRLGAMSWAPFFHPSGDYIIFTTNLHGFQNFELYIVDTAGKRQPVRVSFSEGFDGLPVFSPAGDELYWTKKPRGQSQIYRARWNDAAARKALQLSPVISKPHPSPTIDSAARQRIEENLRALASAEMAGRLTGREGEEKATEYVAKEMQEIGLIPDGDRSSYYQYFDFTAGVSLGDNNSLTLSTLKQAEQSFTVDEDWRPLSFSKSGEISEANVAFAGYGIVTPDENEFLYDSYVHLDVRDKWVMILRFLPQDLEEDKKSQLRRLSSLRYKVMLARDRGARGVLVVTGPGEDVHDELVPLAFDASSAGTSLGIISISNELAQTILGSAGHDLAELQSKLDRGEQMLGIDLPKVQLAARVDLDQERLRGRNVIGRLPASKRSKLPALVVGAHVDHLGLNPGNNSLAADDERGLVHLGADDNASGVAAMLEIARHLSARKDTLKRDVIFAAWSGEELGILGSNHFIAEAMKHHGAKHDLSKVFLANINMDMIGRLKDRLSIQGVNSSPAWRSLLEEVNLASDLAIKLSGDPYLPTDSTAFYLNNVPTLNAFTGAHEDYHTPRDHPDKINYAGLTQITDFLTTITERLVTSDETLPYAEQKRPQDSGTRVQLRAYLGTIPDYTGDDIVGVKLAGVSNDGPADKAGLRKGDIVTELAGKKIENIYDYTYAIEALVVNISVSVTVEREGESLSLEITPSSRQ